MPLSGPNGDRQQRMRALHLVGDPHLDVLHLQAIMLWPAPGDDEKRRQFYAVFAAQRVLNGAAGGEVALASDLLRQLVNAPSLESIRSDAAKQAKRGIMAGYVMLFMAIMEHHKRRLPPGGAAGASLTKALFATKRMGAQKSTWGDGDVMHLAPNTVKPCWQEFRTVAHLWAAQEALRAGGPRQYFMAADMMPAWLEAASYLQQFGLSFLLDSKRARPDEALLPADVWALDPEEHRPRIQFPTDEEFMASPLRRWLVEFGKK